MKRTEGGGGNLTSPLHSFPYTVPSIRYTLYPHFVLMKVVVYLSFEFSLCALCLFFLKEILYSCYGIHGLSSNYIVLYPLHNSNNRAIT